MIELNEDELLRDGEGYDNTQIVSMIELYVRSGKGLSLHELACWAFSRAIDMVPSLLGSVSIYFKFAPAPFERIMVGKLDCELLDTDGIHYLNVVRISLRLLLSDSEIFTTLWDWSCFLDFVQQCAVVKQHSKPEYTESVSDIRWCAVQILSVVLKISDKATANYGIDVKEAFACLLRWQEYCQDVSLEKAGWYLEPYEEKELKSVSGDMIPNLRSTGPVPSTVSISRFHEIETSNSDSRQGAWDVKSSEKPFFLTVTMQKSFEMAFLAVSQSWPVLLYGPMGSGKSALIKKLAQDYGSRGRQVD